MLINLNNICYMHVNFYKRPQIQVNNTHLKMENVLKENGREDNLVILDTSFLIYNQYST